MYELNKVGERTYYISCPTNMGIYKINDTDVCLIDSGNDKDVGKKVLKILEANGWQLKVIINTHSHADHIGGNHLLQERTGCKIYTPEEECAYTNYPNLEPAFLYGGYPYKEIRTKFFMAHPSVAENLTDDVIPEGLEVIRLDGHTFAMIAVKTCDDVWFLADSLVSEFILDKYHISFLVDVKKHLESIEKVKNFKGNLFIPAHAEATKDIVPLAEANSKKIKEIAGAVKSLCAELTTSEDVVKGIFDRYGLKINFTQHTLISSTIRSYISYLYDKGELTAEFCDNKLLWKAV